MGYTYTKKFKYLSATHWRWIKRLIENILLAATYERLGTGIHIPVDKEQDCIKEFMKIPYNYYLPAMIMLGYRSEDAEIPKQVEASVEKNVHWNKW